MDDCLVGAQLGGRRVVARIQIPYFPYFMKSQSPPMMAAESTATSRRYHGYSR